MEWMLAVLALLSFAIFCVMTRRLVISWRRQAKRAIATKTEKDHERWKRRMHALGRELEQGHLEIMVALRGIKQLCERRRLEMRLVAWYEARKRDPLLPLPPELFSLLPGWERHPINRPQGNN